MTVPAHSAALFSVNTDGTEPVENMLVSTIPLSGLSPTFDAGLLQEPPRMLTLGTASTSNAGPPTSTVLDRLPVAATNHGLGCAAGQLSYDFSYATDRYPNGASPTSSVVHTDPSGDNGGGYGDLTRVAVDRYSVNTPPKNDVLVDGDSAPVRTLYPSDLTIDFASAEQSASITYVFPTTWTTTGYPFNPKAEIRTEPVGGDKVKVVVYTGLGNIDLSPSVRKYCFQTRPAGATARSFTVPLTVLGNGDRRVQIPLDEFLSSVPGPKVNDAVGQYRFHTISDPGQVGAYGPIDHVPLLAGYSLAGTDLATGCDLGGGNPGALVYFDRTFTVGQTQPTVELNPSTTTPARGAPVTFDLGNTGAGTKLCSFLPAFTPNDCSSQYLTQSYQQNATAYLSLNTDAGPWDQTQVDIKVQNNRPEAAITRVGTTPAAGTDGSFAIVQGAPVSLPLKVTATDADSSSFTYRWTLDGGTTAVSSTDTYTPSFATPGTYTVRAYVTDDSGDPATEESAAAVYTVTVVRSPQGAVDIVRPARVVNGQPFDIAAETTTGTTGYSTLSWQWDLDGDATTTFDTTHTTRQLTGVVIPAANPSYLVRVRATDAGGRTADATILLNVRRANEAPPLAKFTFTPAAPKSAGAVAFDGSTSELSDPDGALQGPIGPSPANVRFHWTFGDGTPEQVTTAPTTTHTYAGSGHPKASLVVEDLRATPSTSSDPVDHTVDVAPGTTDANAPMARVVRQDPAPSDPVFANRPVTLNAAGSTAAAGHAPLTYAFDLDGNGSYETSTGATPTVTFTPPKAGAVAVGVKVTDALTSTATTTIALDVKAEPVAKPTATLAGPAELQLTGVSVDGAYDATDSVGNNLDPAVTYRWDLDGDGTFETPTGTSPKVTTTFTSPGVKTVTVRVTDRYGNTADAAKTTIVRSAADVAAGCTGVSSFREVSYSNVRLRGCVTSVKRPSAGDLYVVTGKTVQFNGMRLAEASGARPTPRPFADCAAAACKTLESGFNGASAPWAVALDTSDGTLRSNASTALRASGSGIDLPLLSGPLNVSLPSLATDGFTLGTPPDAELEGFPLAGGVTLKFPAAGETSITVVVGLPAVLGGFTGQATIRVTASGGVLLDELKVDVGEVAIGKLTLGDLFFEYDRLDDLWAGGGTLTLPTPKAITISAALSIQHNRFKSISAEVAGLNQPIAQGIYLQAIRAGLAVDPLDLTAGISLSAGPAVKNKSVLSLDGDMRLRFPSPAANYYLFALTGKLKLADFQLASAFAQFSSNGFFEMGGGIDADFDIAYVKAYVKGWIAAKAFNIDGDAEVGVKLAGTRYGLAAAHMTISTTGFGACGEIPVIDVGGGFGVRWGQGVDVFWGCDLSPYRATRPADAPATLGARASAARAAGLPGLLTAPPVRSDLQRGRRLLASPKGHLLQLPAGQEKALLTVTGTTAPPRVSIVNRLGDVLLSTPADGSDVLTKQMLVKSDPKQKTTTILWKAPPGGKAWVLEQSGSSPVSKVDLALPAPKRTLGVTVGGSGRARTLHWDIKPALQPGETVSLAEEGAEAGTQLVTTAQSTGSVPFSPQGGKAGKRSITATISADGLPSTKLVAATYTAPAPPAPAKPASLVLRRSSSGVLAQWTPGTGGGVDTSKWRLLVRVAHTQRKQLFVAAGSARSLRIPDINPGDAVSVSLTGADGSGVEGPARAAIVKAGLRASSGPLSLASTAVPRDVVVRRLAGGKLRVTWNSQAFVRGWSVRVSAAADGKRKGGFTLLRTAGEDHSVDVAGVSHGELRVSVIGRRFQGTVTRKDVTYLGGR
ncbi:MAG: PKD domain-containing protein [Patulibacter sp.]|nr:PKD domain-containing protein [Patulibacter sp.]